MGVQGQPGLQIMLTHTVLDSTKNAAVNQTIKMAHLSLKHRVVSVCSGAWV